MPVYVAASTSAPRSSSNFTTFTPYLCLGLNKLNFTSRSSDFSEILVLEKEFLEIGSKLEICQSLLYEKPLCSSLNGQIEGGLAIPCPPEKSVKTLVFQTLLVRIHLERSANGNMEDTRRGLPERQAWSRMRVTIM